MQNVLAQAQMIKILQEKRKKELRRFIVESCIIIAFIMEESRKIYVKSEKNWPDFL